MMLQPSSDVETGGTKASESDLGCLRSFCSDDFTHVRQYPKENGEANTCVLCISVLNADGSSGPPEESEHTTPFEETADGKVVKELGFSSEYNNAVEAMDSVGKLFQGLQIARKIESAASFSDVINRNFSSLLSIPDFTRITTLQGFGILYHGPEVEHVSISKNRLFCHIKRCYELKKGEYSSDSKSMIKVYDLESLQEVERFEAVKFSELLFHENYMFLGNSSTVHVFDAETLSCTYILMAEEGQYFAGLKIHKGLLLYIRYNCFNDDRKLESFDPATKEIKFVAIGIHGDYAISDDSIFTADFVEEEDGILEGVIRKVSLTSSRVEKFGTPAKKSFYPEGMILPPGFPAEMFDSWNIPDQLLVSSKYLLSTNHEGPISVWDLEYGSLVATLKVQGCVNKMLVRGDSLYITQCGSTFEVWSLSTFMQVTARKNENGNEFNYTDLCIQGDRMFLAAGNSIEVYKV